MKKTLENAQLIANRGGAIAASDWTTGTGNYVSKRPIPAHCIEIDSCDVDRLKGKSKAAATRLMKARPKVQKVIVVADWRSLNRELKQAHN